MQQCKDEIRKIREEAIAEREQEGKTNDIEGECEGSPCEDEFESEEGSEGEDNLFALLLPLRVLRLLLDDAPRGNLEETGLLGRLGCHNCRRSLLSSRPVVVQLVRIVSRRSVTCRLMSISFFLSQEMFNSLRVVPRCSCRATY